MIVTARQLQEKCQEQNVDPYMTFVGLIKAFDTVSRDGLWKIITKFGCPPRYIVMVRQFHDGMQARVQNDGECSEPFPTAYGVKLGCVMAPTMFSIMFSQMLFKTLMLVFQSGTALMASYFTLESCKPNSRCRQMWLISSSMQVTWQKMTNQRKNARGCRSHVKSMCQLSTHN